MKIFDSVQMRKNKYNKFDLSHEKKMSTQFGKLTPTYIQEVIPGDKFKVNSEMLVRFSPLVSPVMHRIDIYTHFFFVPNRIIFDEWEEFITGGEDGLDTTPIPKIAMTETDKGWLDTGSLADFMGVPTMDQTDTLNGTKYFSALPFRAYQEIYNEYYRDQDLVSKIDFSKTSDNITTSNDIADLLTFRNRAYEKDYFTSARPWTQKGAEVGIPVEFNYKAESDLVDFNTDANYTSSGNLTSTSAGKFGHATEGTGRVENLEEEGVTVSINDLRRSNKLQEWLERSARAGSRYIEKIFSHFGVKSSDARLQRPEYLGGGKTPVTISEVLNTSATATEAQGNMAGHGLAVGRTNSFSKSFEEHGFIIGVTSILPKTAYQQGMPRYFKKFDKFDFFWPEFAHIGEQEILNEEIYHDWTSADDANNTNVFGYQDRYSEYKYTPSSVHGDFKDTLSYWHLGRIFSTRPALNDTFINVHPPDLSRIFAVEDEFEDKMYMQIYNSVSAIRQIPYIGVPRLV